MYFDHAGSECRDSRYHRKCTGRWRGEISLGFGGDGKRIRPKVSGRTKTAVYDKLDKLHAELDEGITSSPICTVQQAVDEWLANGLSGRSDKTVTTNSEVLAPLTAIVGNVKLRELTASEVHDGLVKIAVTRSRRAVQRAHNAMVRAITHAQANDKVGRNVAALIKPPEGQAPGRPWKSLTLDRAMAVLAAAERYGLHAYVVVCMLTGCRTEEARALRWDHVFLDAEPPHIAVWRSVRLHGDTKTQKSQRTIRLPEIAVAVLRDELSLQGC